MNKVREQGNLSMQSPTTLNKNPTEQEIAFTRDGIFAANRQEIMPAVEYLLAHYDSLSLSSSIRHDAQICKSINFNTKTHEDLQLTLGKGAQSLTLHISDYRPNEKPTRISVDLGSVTPPNPKLIRIFNELKPVTLELNEAQTTLLQTAISKAQDQDQGQETTQTRRNPSSGYWYQLWKRIRPS